MLLTDRRIQAAKPGEKLSEPAPRGAGRLLVRVTQGGRREFFYRSRVGGRDELRKIGNHGEVSLADARERVRSLAGNPAAAEARGTFSDLLTAYVDHLKAEGKVSAADVERTLLRAVPVGDGLRRRRAADIRPGDVTAMIARRLRQGVTTEANRLRSHLSAAFAHGARCDHDPRRAAAERVRFGLVVNPVAVVANMREYERTSDRALTWNELGAYWRALKNESLVCQATLRFVLAMGGQRMQQVLRAEWTNIDAGIIRLTDKKGRGEPRVHALPIVPLAQAQLDALAGQARPFPISHFTLADAISRASAVVCKALKCEPFDARDLRRTVETRLGDLGVSREALSHLLSHGRTGVQEKHYDRAERLDEKRNALKLWTRHLQKAIKGRRP